MVNVVLMQVFSIALFFAYKFYAKSKLKESYGLLIVTECLFVLYSGMCIISGVDAEILLSFVAVAVGVYIAYIDIKRRVISMKLCLFIAIVALVFSFVRNDVSFYNPIVTAVVFYLFSLFLRWISKQQMGDGDVKLIAVYGGVYAFPQVMSVLFYSFLSCLLVGIILVLRKKQNMKLELPFAPFMIIGAVVFDILKYMIG